MKCLAVLLQKTVITVAAALIALLAVPLCILLEMIAGIWSATEAFVGWLNKVVCILRRNKIVTGNAFLRVHKIRRSLCMKTPIAVMDVSGTIIRSELTFEARKCTIRPGSVEICSQNAKIKIGKHEIQYGTFLHIRR